ncbi:MAG TPA: DUF6659 family protein [Nitrososphaera sp.]|jgi:hypothetical protein|nr:DUF6659 family protein [Nitrososphaera sp.]
MRESNLCDRIIKLDRSIRFVGIVNNRGEVIEGGFKQGIEPLLNGTEEQHMYIHSLSNLTMLQSYSDRLGMVRYSLTEHEKVILMTFPLRDGILCLSAMPKANMNKIRDKVMKVLKSKSNSSTRSSSTGGNKPTRKQ